jgi:hypothetical protein
VHRLGFGDGPEQARNLWLPVFLRLLREKQVAAVGLALTGKSRLQIFLGITHLTFLLVALFF